MKRLWMLALVAVVTLPAAAFQGDWVLAERFAKRMEQAKAGDPAAMYDVGKMYQRGHGVPRSIPQAVQWLARAAAKGNASAQTSLGVLYFEGREVKPDPARALRFLQSAAARKVPQAMFYLGRAYEEGRGVKRNLNLALRWYRRAAEGGYYGAVDKVHAVQARLRQSAGRAQAASGSSSTRPIEALLGAHWERGGEPVGFLPSRMTSCEAAADGKSATCVSRPHSRPTPAAVITYVTRTTVEAPDGAGRFTLRYINEVTEVKPREIDAVVGEDLGGMRVSVKVGQRSKPHVLECRFKGETLQCVRDRAQSLVLTRTRPAAAATATAGTATAN